MVDNAEYAKIVQHHFSDYVLDFLSKNTREIADRLAHTKLSNEAAERLVKAYDSNIITYGDLLHISTYSLVSGGCEKYLNDYFSSIAAGLDSKTASQILVASKFEDWSYNEIYSLVKSGTYAVSDRTFVQLTPDVAREIDKLGMELWAYDKSNDFYLVKDVEKAIQNGDAITFSKSDLAVKINEMRTQPDWEDFRNYIAEDIEDIETLTCDGLVEAYHDYQREELNIELSNRVNRNFEAFIDVIRDAGVDEAITRCYEISVKNNIQEYLENEEPIDLPPEQYEALLTRTNPLDEIYESWLKCEGLASYTDIPKAVEHAAERIGVSLEREKSATVELTMTAPKNDDVLFNAPQTPKKKGGAR